MKRYDPFQPEIIGRDMYESSDGEYVLYDDIKDDRALLEEAVEYIRIFEAVCHSKEGTSILKRAKERGIG